MLYFDVMTVQYRFELIADRMTHRVFNPADCGCFHCSVFNGADTHVLTVPYSVHLILDVLTVEY